MESVIVGWSDGGNVASLFCTSLLALHEFERSNPCEEYTLESFSSRSSIYVQENRNNLVKTLLDSDAEWLLQIDADESFEPYLLRQLMKAADPVTRPIVVGLYTNVGRVDGQGGIQLINCVYKEAENGQYLAVDPPENLQPFQVAAAGTGVMLCHRSVFEALEYPWFWVEMFENEDGSRQMMNEDIAFCRSATTAGFEIWCDPLVEVVHWKTLPLVPSTVREQLRTAERVFSEMSAEAATE